MSTASMSGVKSTLTVLSDREIQMTRVFAAPRELVWKALTDPTMSALWWGRTGSNIVVDKFDFQPGGVWRFVEHGADGSENGFRGEFREIVPVERVVQTFGWEGLPGHVVVDTMTLEELGDMTRITSHSLFASVEDCDGMMASGMESGANESWDKLGELLATLQA